MIGGSGDWLRWWLWLWLKLNGVWFSDCVNAARWCGLANEDERKYGNNDGDWLANVEKNGWLNKNWDAANEEKCCCCCCCWCWCCCCCCCASIWFKDEDDDELLVWLACWSDCEPGGGENELQFDIHADDEVDDGEGDDEHEDEDDDILQNAESVEADETDVGGGITDEELLEEDDELVVLFIADATAAIAAAAATVAE